MALLYERWHYFIKTTDETVAVEKQDDGSYKLAVKHTSISSTGGTDTTDTKWSVYSIDSAGVIDLRPASGTISNQESDFNQDLNLDGVQGRSGTLSKVATDTIGARLRRDSENTLYIDVDGDDSTSDDLIPIVDSKGGSQTFDSSTSFVDGSVTSSWAEEAVAIEGQSDGTYRLAVKSTATSNGNTSVDWNMYSISSSGVLSDTESVWYPSASDIPITVFTQI